MIGFVLDAISFHSPRLHSARAENCALRSHYVIIALLYKTMRVCDRRIRAGRAATAALICAHAVNSS